MNRLTQKVFENTPCGYFRGQDAAILFPQSDDVRYGLVKRAIVAGQIIHLRRNLFCLTPTYQKRKINLYALSEHLYGPSYVSLESALSWHGWIPEAVYTMTSVSLGKSKEFRTPLGTFSYNRVPQEILYAGVQRVTSDAGDMFFMASPMKALADYVYVHKKNWTGLKPAADSLRIEPHEFESTTTDDFEELIDNYTSRRVRNFLVGTRKDLNR